MNPCPCGYAGDPRHQCSCSPDQIQRYQQRVSGPLLDRIDIQVNLPRLSTEFLLREEDDAESSLTVRERVSQARQRQLQRSGIINSQLSNRQLATHCQLGSAESKLLGTAVEKLGLSVRAYHRILRLCRSIADLDCCENIEHPHLVEALGYRQLKLENKDNPVI
jgi:magnesium chelatase family protein